MVVGGSSEEVVNGFWNWVLVFGFVELRKRVGYISGVFGGFVVNESNGDCCFG